MFNKSTITLNKRNEMIELKKDAVKLFKKLFSGQSRTRQNWKEMLWSLAEEKEVTEKKVRTWFYFGTTPTIDENPYYSK